MHHLDIIRAWKDEKFRHSLSAAEREQLPDNPVGAIELSDEEMEQAQGGTISNWPTVSGCTYPLTAPGCTAQCSYSSC